MAYQTSLLLQLSLNETARGRTNHDLALQQHTLSLIELTKQADKQIVYHVLPAFNMQVQVAHEHTQIAVL